MDHVDFLDRYHHAPLNLNFASDCQLKGSQREEGLRATPSLVVLCLFLLRTQILSKHHHLFFPFAKGHSKAERNISVFQGNTLQDEPLCPSITAVSLSSIYHSRHLQCASTITAHIPAQAMPVAKGETAELGAWAGSLLWHCHKDFNILVLFHQAAKLQNVRFSMERTCDLGTGESNKSHNLEIVGLWAPEKLKIEQLVLLVDESLLGSQGMMLRDCLGQVWAPLKLCQSHSLSTKYFNSTELANSNKNNISAHFSLSGKRPSFLEQALW